MSSEAAAVQSFRQLALIEPVLKALEAVGYETPSPIQAETIPLLLEGRDLVGQAQTGTGKTAAFALPILSRIDLTIRDPQVLVLAPTRELAIQVAEAFQKYAAAMKDFHVMPIYGGQEYGRQINMLKRGVHVVVGTPGRVMDHMRRGTLKLDNLKALVLDEADEMLRMGFIDDVEWILSQTPTTRQIALFSATMPTAIRRIAKQYLNDPAEVTIKTVTTTAASIRQRYWLVSGLHKLDALSRILEAEDFSAIIIFVRTKLMTVELEEKLAARGYAAAALSGDIQQKQRERIIEKLKGGQIDIVIATDVAARGLDVERISHVINYDIPTDTEAYVHRIGRTGRAGRKGDAILFVAPRERNLLKAIERATRQQIDLMELPSTEILNDKRIANFKQRITDTLEAQELGMYQALLEAYQQEHNIPAIEIAAALANLLQGDEPLLLKDAPRPSKSAKSDRPPRDRGARDDRPARKSRDRHDKDEGMQTFRIEVGHNHGVKPANIVGAIANEAGLDSAYIGQIKIHDEYSTVDLPEGMPKEVFRDLQKVWVSGQQLNISRLGEKRAGDGYRAKLSLKDKQHKGDKGKPDRDKNDEARPARGKSDKSKSDKGKPSKGKFDKAKPARGKSDKGKPARGKPAKGKPAERKGKK
ncbi:MAG: DEAD/DEAH box helicase [Gammaproteobacteria bacterium]|nr:DEAD/DEAH box helicase [Gammaproteobacteria bacterium]MDH5650576.1 DEAD/DEAH box helicase [Gammaproteobacteria bacterium]